MLTTSGSTIATVSERAARTDGCMPPTSSCAFL